MLVVRRWFNADTDNASSDTYIKVGDITITVRLVSRSAGGARVGIDAPEGVKIVRADAIKKE